MPSAGAAWVDVSASFAPFREAVRREIGPALAPFEDAIKGNLGGAFKDAGATAGDALRGATGAASGLEDAVQEVGDTFQDVAATGADGLRSVSDETGGLEDALKKAGSSVTNDLLRPLRDLGVIGSLSVGLLVRELGRFAKSAIDAFRGTSEGEAWGDMFADTFRDIREKWQELLVFLGEGLVAIVSFAAPIVENLLDVAVPLADMFGDVLGAIGGLIDVLEPVLTPVLTTLALIVLPALTAAFVGWAAKMVWTSTVAIAGLVSSIFTKLIPSLGAATVAAAGTAGAGGLAGALAGVGAQAMPLADDFALWEAQLLKSSTAAGTLTSSLAGIAGFAIPLAGVAAAIFGISQAMESASQWQVNVTSVYEATVAAINAAFQRGEINEAQRDWAIEKAKRERDEAYEGGPLGGNPQGGVTGMASGGDILSDGLVFAHSGERVLPAAQVAPLPATGPAIESHYHFHGVVVGDDDTWRKFARKISTYQGQELRRLGYGRMG